MRQKLLLFVFSICTFLLLGAGACEVRRGDPTPPPGAGNRIGKPGDSMTAVIQCKYRFKDDGFEQTEIERVSITQAESGSFDGRPYCATYQNADLIGVITDIKFND